MASQKKEKLAAPASPIMASQAKAQSTVKVTATQGKGQKSKTVRVNGLKLRVRLNDQSYRVMLLASDGEPYLCSLPRSEWAEVEHDSAAFLAMVKEKLHARIAKANAEDAPKLRTLLTTIEETRK